MMKRPEVKIVLTPYAMSWMETFMAQAGEVRAEVLWPEAPSRPEPLREPEAVVPQPAWDPALRPHGPDSDQPDP